MHHISRFRNGSGLEELPNEIKGFVLVVAKRGPRSCASMAILYPRLDHFDWLMTDSSDT